MGVYVKRFRTLGQLQKRVVSESSIIDSSEVVSVQSPVVSVSKIRKTRIDKKHQYPLRVVTPFWSRITNLNLNCRGVESGPSLNETLCDLLESALDDEGIMKCIMSKYPDRDIVIVHSWDRG